MKRATLTAAVLLTAAALAGLRLAGEHRPAFQAAAHLEVGALLGWAAAGRRWFPAAVAAALSVVEVAAFVLARTR